MILASGDNIDLEEIEAHYCQSPFVKEICVIGLTERRPAASERLYAVVVPNMDLIRARKIVNVGDLLRFELEGLGAALLAHQRVSSYDVSFEPLPRTTTRDIARQEVEQQARARQHRAQHHDAPLPADDQAWLDSPGAAPVVAIIQARVKSAARVRPDANLEMDLGFDSMERVELLSELESRLGVGVSQTKSAEIFTVRHLVDALSAEAVRGSAAGFQHVEKRDLVPNQHSSSATKVDHHDRPWAAILRDLPSATDPALGWLLRRRTFAAPFIFVLMKIVGFLFFLPRVRGLDKLPASGPYLICPNHQSYVDPFVLCGVVPYRVFKEIFFVGAVEYFETAFTRWVAHTANLVPVDPDSNLVSAMKAGAFGLAHGKILMLFPEGERSIDGTVKKFKKGAPILGQHLGVPIVPVALKGIYELWPRNRGINWRVAAPWSGHRVSIEIGEPMMFAESANYNDSTSQLRERVNAMWEALST